MKYLFTLALLCGLAHGDSIGPVFALQQSQGLAPSYLSQTNIQLTGNPLLSPTLVTHYLTGNYLAFLTTFQPMTGPMEVTLTIQGVTYTTGAFVRDLDNCINSFVLPRTFYHPKDGVLTIHIGDESESFAFRFVDPVPEPETWTLILIGSVLIACYYPRKGELI